MIKVFLLYQEHNKDCCCCCYLRASCKTTQKDVVTPRKVILVSVFHDSRYGILDSLSLALGLRIPIVKILILELNSGFHETKFAGFQSPQTKISRIIESTNKNFQDSGIRRGLHGVTVNYDP